PRAGGSRTSSGRPRTSAAVRSGSRSGGGRRRRWKDEGRRSRRSKVEGRKLAERKPGRETRSARGERSHEIDWCPLGETEIEYFRGQKRAGVLQAGGGLPDGGGRAVRASL